MLVMTRLLSPTMRRVSFPLVQQDHHPVQEMHPPGAGGSLPVVIVPHPPSAAVAHEGDHGRGSIEGDHGRVPSRKRGSSGKLFEVGEEKKKESADHATVMAAFFEAHKAAKSGQEPTMKGTAAARNGKAAKMLL